jgi:hypothetical protein
MGNNTFSAEQICGGDNPYFDDLIINLNVKFARLSEH